MALPFRHFHLFSILTGYEKQHLPIDVFLRKYFRQHVAIGSKDRAFIAETLYAMTRWKATLEHCCEAPFDWEKRFNVFQDKAQWEKVIEDSSVANPTRCSFPSNLYTKIVDTHGEEKGFDICLASNTPAPTTVRVNTLKISRKELFNQWQSKFPVRLCESSKEGIIFEERINFFGLPEFKQGYFEVQDEGSQLIAQMLQIKPGDHVLDYCSGSGGKTLAFAPFMENKGQIYLHDVRPHALIDCKKRLKRAGIQNAQIFSPEHPTLSKLKHRIDWVLVDAPCSGTGTLRRNPDMKWKFTDDQLHHLQKLQRKIFEKSLKFLKPDGKIVYATCSLLKEENQDQVDYFLSKFPIKLEGTPFQSIPTKGSMDGFFGAVFSLKN